MVDKKRRGVVPLTPHDLEMLQGPRSEWSLTALPAIALTDMTDGKVPLRANLREGRAMYGDLAKAPFSVFSVAKEGSQDKGFIMVGPSLTAEQVNGLMYFAAPYKGFGFDTEDIINDWTDLYNDPAHANRKKAHAMMPGWGQFEKSRERILGVLTRNFETVLVDEYNSERRFRNDDDDVLIPVLRWSKDTKGESKIILEPLDDGLKIALAQALPQQITDTDRLDSGIGMMFVSAYSPEQTRWPSKDGYRHSNSSSTQQIGPTQVLAYAYREVAKQQADASQVSSDQDIQGSRLLYALNSYVETGEAPTVDIVGTSVDELYEPTPTGVAVQPTALKPLTSIQVPANLKFPNVTGNPYYELVSKL